MCAEQLMIYQGQRVLVTGGLGFIGSNLVRSLVEVGADVLVVDNLAPDQGGGRPQVKSIVGGANLLCSQVVRA